MKEITRIHLARTPFNIEIEARKALEKYLAEIEKTLHADDDIMREIEARIIEILAERGVSFERAITASDVEAVETRLGTPSDFVDESDTSPTEELKNDKRLLRDTEHGTLGGVCAGIANYFGVNVMWPRLVTILLMLMSFGAAILVYIVLWVVIPPARTAAEKLQMRGERVTLAALKDETVEAVKTPERSKPLVLALRIFLGLSFAVTALGSVGLIIVMIFVREPLFNSAVHDLVTTQTFDSVGLAYVMAIFSGLLFATLMVIASYVSFCWTINKKLLVSAGVVVALGLASFATAVGLGVQGAHEIHQQIEKNTVTEIKKIAELGEGVKGLAFNGTEVLPVEYHVTNGAARLEFSYLRGQNRPQVDIARSGDQATIFIKDQEACDDRYPFCRTVNRVVIYGPSLDAVTVKSGSFSYFADKQSHASFTVASDASLILQGDVTALDATIDNHGWLEADSSTISSAKLNQAVGSEATLGGLDTLALTVPKICNAGKAQISYRSANSFTVNDVPITNSSELISCVQINNRGE